MRFLFALAVGFALSVPASAADPPAPTKKSDKVVSSLDQLLDVLHEKEVIFVIEEGGNINEFPLFELVQKLSKQYNLTFVINEEAFRAEGVADIKEKKPTVAATQLKGMSVHQFLIITLESMNATYLVKGGRLEIVPISFAAKLTKAPFTEVSEDHKILAEPLVSLVVKEKPLNEVVALIAERHDLTVIVSPQSGDARTGFVTARMLNVPADQALELLAVQCDLRVVRKGKAYLITSRDHANELFGERLEKERQKIEVEKLRREPLPPPEAPKPPEVPKPDK